MRNTFGCKKCYPRLCSCPLEPHQKLAALAIALSSPLWSEEEKVAIKKEYDELIRKTK